MHPAGLWILVAERSAGFGADFVGKWDLVRFGRTTKRLDHRNLTELTDAERRNREAARMSLEYPPVQLTGVPACAIGRGFADART